MVTRGVRLICRTCDSQLGLSLAQPGKKRSRTGTVAALLFLVLFVSGILGAGWWWMQNGGLAQEEAAFDEVAATEASMETESATASTPAAATAPAVPNILELGAALVNQAAEAKAAATAAARPVADAGSLRILLVIQRPNAADFGSVGRLYVATEAPRSDAARLTGEVGSGMKASFEDALLYVRKQPRDWEKQYSLNLSFNQRFIPKDGSSAGAAFTLAMLAATEGTRLDPDVAVTGDLTIDGAVQPVSGIVEKVRAAAQEKTALTLLPLRNSSDIDDLVVLDGPAILWETQLFTISTIEEAKGLAARERGENVTAAIDRFRRLRARLPAAVTPSFLQSPIVRSELQAIVQLAPNHLSASTLLRAADGTLPQTLSLNQSAMQVIGASKQFAHAMTIVTGDKEQTRKQLQSGQFTFPERDFAACMQRLSDITPKLHPRTIDLKVAYISLVNAARAAAKYELKMPTGPMTAQEGREFIRLEQDRQRSLVATIEQARSRYLLAAQALSFDSSISKELLAK